MPVKIDRSQLFIGVSGSTAAQRSMWRCAARRLASMSAPRLLRPRLTWTSPSARLAAVSAAGCSVVLKPPPETPLIGYALADAFADAGLPDGLLSILPAGRQVGEHLVRHQQIDKVAFTGSTAAGKRIMVSINGRAQSFNSPLGGFKQSGMGREMGPEGFRAYLEVKSIAV